MPADYVLINGNIYTLDPLNPRVTALAIDGGRIAIAGSDAEMQALPTTGGKPINLGGRTVIPGLVDSHVHLTRYAQFLHNVDLTGAKSAEDCAELVREFAHKVPKGEWIQGHGWNQDRWPDRAFPHARYLDALVPDHPVYLVEHSIHAAWVNSLALQLAHITGQTPNPAGGEIGKDADGNPNGLLFETAQELITQVMPVIDAEQNARMVKVAIERAQQSGLVGVHDFDEKLAFETYQVLHQRGDLNFRIVKNIPVQLLDHAIALGLRWGFGDDLLRIGGIKTFIDGALGPRTAWMIEPYLTEPSNYGIVVTDPEEFADTTRRASIAGLPATVHAIGDKAIHEVLNVFDTMRREEAERGISPEQMRHRIEHVQHIHPDDVGRLGQLRIIASMQPNHATSDMDKTDTYLGDKRADYSFNWRAQLDAGAVLALGSDAPIEPIEPLPNIQAAVTRRRADGSPGETGWRSGADGHGRLTVMEALEGFTVGAAYAAGLEDRQGQLKPGYFADLVVLDRDIFTCNPMEIGSTPVVGTMCNGVWVYRIF